MTGIPRMASTRSGSSCAPPVARCVSQLSGWPSPIGQGGPRPSLCVFAPQPQEKRSPSSLMASTWRSCAATVCTRTSRRDSTRVARARSTRSPWPKVPCCPAPHVYKSPISLTAKMARSLTATELMRIPASASIPTRGWACRLSSRVGGISTSASP
eukprot:scaffold111781_cov35-Tisochrysis_lutea.AAC.2